METFRERAEKPVCSTHSLSLLRLQQMSLTRTRVAPSFRASEDDDSNVGKGMQISKPCRNSMCVFFSLSVNSQDSKELAVSKD